MPADAPEREGFPGDSPGNRPPSRLQREGLHPAGCAMRLGVDQVLEPARLILAVSGCRSSALSTVFTAPTPWGVVGIPQRTNAVVRDDQCRGSVARGNTTRTASERHRATPTAAAIYSWRLGTSLRRGARGPQAARQVVRLLPLPAGSPPAPTIPNRWRTAPVSCYTDLSRHGYAGRQQPGRSLTH